MVMSVITLIFSIMGEPLTFPVWLLEIVAHDGNCPQGSHAGMLVATPVPEYSRPPSGAMAFSPLTMETNPLTLLKLYSLICRRLLLLWQIQPGLVQPVSTGVQPERRTTGTSIVFWASRLTPSAGSYQCIARYIACALCLGVNSWIAGFSVRTGCSVHPPPAHNFSATAELSCSIDMEAVKYNYKSIQR